jgi:hypothetical protein
MKIKAQKEESALQKYRRIYGNIEKSTIAQEKVRSLDKPSDQGN